MRFPLISSSEGSPWWVMLRRSIKFVSYTAIDRRTCGLRSRFRRRTSLKNVSIDMTLREEPTCNQSKVGVIDGSIISHLGLASIRVLTMGEELVHGVEGVGLDSVVRGKHNEHGRFRLRDVRVSKPDWAP